MPIYYVTWEINIEADNAIEAAQKALEIQRLPGGTATVFTVQADNLPPVEIDLMQVQAKRKPRQHFEYRGVTVWRHTEPGCQLRYYTLGGLAADTQEGIKKLIREKKNGS